MKAYMIFLVLLMVPPVAAGQGRVSGRTNGGTYRFTYGLNTARRARMEGEIRRFVWEHWKQKRRGRIAAQYYSIEGDPTTHSLEVRPDSNGTWVLRSEIDHRSSSIFLLISRPWRFNQKTILSSDVFDSLERVRPHTRPRPFAGELPDLDTLPGDRLDLIPESEQPSPDKYRLHFKSSSRPKLNWLL